MTISDNSTDTASENEDETTKNDSKNCKPKLQKGKITETDITNQNFTFLYNPPQISIPEFCGSATENVHEWIETTEEAAKSQNWPDNIILNQACIRLYDSARTWYKLKKPTIKTWDNLKEAIIKDFGNEDDTQEKLRNALESRIQGKNEPALRYAEEILHLCNKVDPNMEVRKILEYLTYGINETISFLLIIHPIESTQFFLELCKKYDQHIKNREKRFENHFKNNQKQFYRPNTQSKFIGNYNNYNNNNNRLNDAHRNMTNSNYTSPPPRHPTPQIIPPPRRINNFNYFNKNNSQTPRPNNNNYRLKEENFKSRNLNENRLKITRTPDNKPICFACHRPGHVRRYCRQPKVRCIYQTQYENNHEINDKLPPQNEFKDKSPNFRSQHETTYRHEDNNYPIVDQLYKPYRRTYADVCSNANNNCKSYPTLDYNSENEM